MNPPSQKQIRTVALASLLGATIEWYDFFLYGVVAGIVFNKLYFPTDDPFIGTLLAYSTFAIGYLARPFGAFVFGHFGDKIGRKSMLVLTMLIMGIGGHRSGAHLCPDRHRRSHHPPDFPPHAGPGPRRRMGRLRAHDLRIRQQA